MTSRVHRYAGWLSRVPSYRYEGPVLCVCVLSLSVSVSLARPSEIQRREISSTTAQWRFDRNS